jgi:hypothetical protein
MFNKIAYSAIADELRKRIPEFDGYVHEAHNPIIYLGFFIDFLKENIIDETIVKREATFLNDMVDTQDQDVDILLEDVFLNIFSMFKEHDVSTEKILKNFNSNTLEMYHDTVRIWLKANSESSLTSE